MGIQPDKNLEDLKYSFKEFELDVRDIEDSKIEGTKKNKSLKAFKSFNKVFSKLQQLVKDTLNSIKTKLSSSHNIEDLKIVGKEIDRLNSLLGEKRQFETSDTLNKFEYLLEKAKTVSSFLTKPENVQLKQGIQECSKLQENLLKQLEKLQEEMSVASQKETLYVNWEENSFFDSKNQISEKSVEVFLKKGIEISKRAQKIGLNSEDFNKESLITKIDREIFDKDNEILSNEISEFEKIIEEENFAVLEEKAKGLYKKVNAQFQRLQYLSKAFESLDTEFKDDKVLKKFNSIKNNTNKLLSRYNQLLSKKLENEESEVEKLKDEILKKEGFKKGIREEEALAVAKRNDLDTFLVGFQKEMSHLKNFNLESEKYQEKVKYIKRVAKTVELLLEAKKITEPSEKKALLQEVKDCKIINPFSLDRAEDLLISKEFVKSLENINEIFDQAHQDWEKIKNKDHELNIEYEKNTSFWEKEKEGIQEKITQIENEITEEKRKNKPDTRFINELKRDIESKEKEIVNVENLIKVKNKLPEYYKCTSELEKILKRLKSKKSPEKITLTELIEHQNKIKKTKQVKVGSKEEKQINEIVDKAMDAISVRDKLNTENNIAYLIGKEAKLEYIYNQLKAKELKLLGVGKEIEQTLQDSVKLNKGIKQKFIKLQRFIDTFKNLREEEVQAFENLDKVSEADKEVQKAQDELHFHLEKLAKWKEAQQALPKV